MTVPELTEDQITTILVEGVSRGMLEVPNGTLPDDPKQRLDDATSLVSAVMVASKNGNKSENVEAILAIANNGVKTVAAPIQETVVTEPAPVAESNSSGLDLTQVADNILELLIAGLDDKGDTEDVRAARAEFLAEKERRGNASPEEIQEIPQAEEAGASPEKPAEAGSEAQAEGISAGSEASTEPTGDDGTSEQGTGVHGESTSQETDDASAFARAQTVEESGKGRKNVSPSPEENEHRTKVEESLSLPMLKAHNVDITKLGKIPIEKLEFIVANPEGPPQEDKKVIEERDVEAVSNPDAGAVVGGINVGVSVPPPSVSKADLGLEIPEEETRSNISAEREQLESMVTGPMLKAYGRGRKEVPNIGDHELRFMILNADGKVTPEQLAAAKASDSGVPATEVIAQQIPEPEPAAAPAPDRSITQAAQEAVAKQEQQTVVAPPVVVEAEQQGTVPDKASGQSRAMEIIAKENFPIPPEIDGQPPMLPNDVSACSRDELFSLHAGFHACESRINWVISGFEDELGDLEKLRSDREITVAASVPLVIEDKRVTNEYRDSQVAADAEVRDYSSKEHEVGKTIRKLKVLQKNYHADCERLSRQMSKYERERLDAPR